MFIVGGVQFNVQCTVINNSETVLYACLPLPPSQEDYPVPKIDPVAREAAECLHHWKIKLFELYAVSHRQKGKFHL